MASAVRHQPLEKVVYREYIASDTWKQKRVDALNRSGRKNPVSYLRSPRCEFCGQYGMSHKNPRSSLDSRDRRFRVDGSNGLQVHHATYKRLGNEHADDLIVLCTDSCYYEEYFRSRSARFPERVGCHERVHDDPEFRLFIEQFARKRTY